MELFFFFSSLSRLATNALNHDLLLIVQFEIMPVYTYC